MLNGNCTQGLEALLDRCGKLVISVTGHRRNRLSDDDCARVEAGFSAIFDVIAAGPGGPVSLQSGLAAGTDLAAARSCPEGWRLHGLLAMPVADWLAYLGRESPADAACFQRLAADPRVELSVLPAPWPNYGGLAERLVTTGDVLLAVWDGTPGSEGGTSDVVARACAAGIPTFVFDPTAHDGWRSLTPAENATRKRNSPPE